MGGQPRRWPSGTSCFGAVCLGYSLLPRGGAAGDPAGPAGEGPALHAEQAATPPAADAEPVGTPELPGPRSAAGVAADQA